LAASEPLALADRDRLTPPTNKKEKISMSRLLATRRAVLLSMAAFGSAAAGGLAFADAYPTHPVRVIIPFGPGGVGDITIRIVADKLSEKFGKRFYIENMPSPDGIVAGHAVLSAPADGYTLLLLTGGTPASIALYNQFPLDIFKDFTPISAMGFFDCLMVVNATSPYKTLSDFLAADRAKPGTLNVGTVTAGGLQNLTTNYLKQASGANFVIVPFRTTPDATVALLRDDVQMVIDYYAALKPGLASHQSRAIAWTGATPSPALPDIQTAGQQGVKNFTASSWNSLYAKAGTPPEIIATLNTALHEVLADADVKRKLLDLGVDSRASTPEEIDTRLHSDVKKWTEVIARAGLPKH
jgi:tripartite-type tricarboxylate transporter receptor subunit TctC